MFSWRLTRSGSVVDGSPLKRGRVRTQKASHPRLAFQQALFEASKAVNSTLDTQEVLDRLVQQVAQATGVKASSLFLLSPGREQLIRSAHWGLSAGFVRKGPVLTDLSITEALQGKVVAIQDATTDPRVQYGKQNQREGIASILCIPVLLRQEIIGVLRLYTAEPRTFSQEEVDFASAVASLGALALENAKLYESLKSSYQDVQRGILEWYTPADKVRPAHFAHPSEEEFAKILDFYHLPWHYEPRSFPLRWEDGRVVEMFTPDYYLPSLDLYLELTTMRQSLVTEKNRKVRRLRELYPEVNIRLLYRKDYYQLLAKYGYGPVKAADMHRIDRVLFSAWEIEKRVKELAEQISQDYRDRRPVLVGVLKGVTCFMADLIRYISLPIAIDFLAITSFESERPGAVRIVKDLSQDIAGADVLLVEDIVDTGFTLQYLVKHLSSHSPASLRVCTLLDKRVRRLIEVPLDYVGFEIPDESVVGFGLDYREEYRNLPFIAVLREVKTEVN